MKPYSVHARYLALELFDTKNMRELAECLYNGPTAEDLQCWHVDESEWRGAVNYAIMQKHHERKRRRRVRHYTRRNFDDI